VAFRIYQLQQGVAVEAVSTVQLLDTGLTGARGALRRLTHPTAGTFAPLTYYLNPTRTVNYDNDVLRSPITSVIRTLSASRVIQFAELTEDVIVQEIWEAGGGLSMPVFMFRLLYEYLVNPPAFSASVPVYVQWEPRDRSDQVFNVQLLSLEVGGRGYSIRHWQSDGGPNDPRTPTATGLTPTDTMDVAPTALLDQPVTLTMRIVDEVV
jgi:hypothetical protein